MLNLLICAVAGLAAGASAGFAGISTAVIIAPILITFVNIPAYEAVTIALAADVPASAAAAVNYGRHKNLRLGVGLRMLIPVLIFTFVGSYVASLLHDNLLSHFSFFMTLLMSARFIFSPVTEPKDNFLTRSPYVKALTYGAGCVIGFICGFVGAGGGMMLLLVLTTLLGFDLRSAVGTSVFIMTFTALTGAASHWSLGGVPDVVPLLVCTAATFVGALLSSTIANYVQPRTLNRILGAMLGLLSIAMLILELL